MNKKVYKPEFTDILMNFFIGRNSIPFIAEWLEEKYFCNNDYLHFSKKISDDNSFSVEGIEQISDPGSDIVKTRETGKQFNEGIKQLSDEAPAHCKLFQNCPNPFSKKTIINYQCSCNSFISLKIYDIKWNDISTLIYEKTVPGTYQIEFDGSGLKSGVYFCRLTVISGADEFTETKRMLLII